ncbi:MAG: zinc-ribbon domain-containing protein [Gemmatimonadota bacterium]
MNVSCPECHSVFRVDPAKVTGANLRARCSICAGLIPVGASVRWADDFPSSLLAGGSGSPAAGSTGIATPAVSPAIQPPGIERIGVSVPAQPSGTGSAPPTGGTAAADGALRSERSPSATPIRLAAAHESHAASPEPSRGHTPLTPAFGTPLHQPVTTSPFGAPLAPSTEPSPVGSANMPRMATPVAPPLPPLPPRPAGATTDERFAPPSRALGAAPFSSPSGQPAASTPVAATPGTVAGTATPAASGLVSPSVLTPAASAPIDRPPSAATPASAAPVDAARVGAAASLLPASVPATSNPAPSSAPRSVPPAGSTAAPTRRPINPFLSNDPNQKARRLARALVSDMVAYHPQKREEGARTGTLKPLFREEIKKSYEEYVEQVGREFAESTTHFQEALNDILAGGKRIF